MNLIISDFIPKTYNGTMDSRKKFVTLQNKLRLR